MAQQDGAAKKNPAVAALHSHFMVGSVSEENSEDENQGKADLQLEEKEIRSLSPSSGSSDSTYEIGFDHIDGPIHNLRLECKPDLSVPLQIFQHSLLSCQRNSQIFVFSLMLFLYGGVGFKWRLWFYVS